jgi:LysM repeat protein
MFRKSGFIFQIVIISIMVSCRAYRAPVQTGKTEGSVESYVNIYKDLAISEMRRTGIPASITLAQGIIESDMGRSRLASEANNHFGIKCHDDWTGPTIRHTDDRRNECFRKYRKPEESFHDHSDFLISEPRYRSLFSLDPTDYKGWARGLKRAGYATNPDYANMLIRKIDEYNLYIYDRSSASSGKKSKDNNAEIDRTSDSAVLKVGDPDNITEKNISVTALPVRVKENNRIQYVIVNERDTKESLEKDFQLLRWELQKYNELGPDFTLTPGQILYIQPKREKAEPGKEFHYVAEGETMYGISQIYGIKLKNLYIMNRVTADSVPVKGQKIWLRSVKPADQ